MLLEREMQIRFSGVLVRNGSYVHSVNLSLRRTQIHSHGKNLEDQGFPESSSLHIDSFLGEYRKHRIIVTDWCLRVKRAGSI